MILLHEGGVFTNYAADRGGPTKWGITIPVLSKHRGRKCTAEDVRLLTRDEAASIYITNYISPFRLMEPTIFRANVIDMSVNAGLTRGVRLMQQTIGAKVDGDIGPETIKLAKSRDWNALYVGVRLAFYERIIENDPTQIVWRNGWRRRGLSFYGTEHRMPLRMGDSPVFGTQAKAFLYAA
jgi:lysozyme family protein